VNFADVTELEARSETQQTTARRAEDQDDCASGLWWYMHAATRA